MKNLGSLAACLVLFFACSTPTVEVVKLSDGKKGYDVSCLGSLDKCQQRAKVLCDKGQYRVHNTYSNNLSMVETNDDLIMRLQCLDEQASLEQCSLPGVSCVL
jgi:hypothetical protein